MIGDRNGEHLVLGCLLKRQGLPQRPSCTRIVSYAHSWTKYWQNDWTVIHSLNQESPPWAKELPGLPVKKMVTNYLLKKTISIIKEVRWGMTPQWPQTEPSIPKGFWKKAQVQYYLHTWCKAVCCRAALWSYLLLGQLRSKQISPRSCYQTQHKGCQR